MVVTEGDPLPRRLLADINMVMSPSLTLSKHGSGLKGGAVQISCTHNGAGMMRDLQMLPVLESV